ncbi:MAG: hypothetical protein ACK4V4_10210 [Sphingobacteriales bacterium]
MRKQLLVICSILFSYSIYSQVMIDPKGTRVTIDSSKWKLTGNNLSNKNSGLVGIGTFTPTAQLHSKGTLRFEGLGSNTTQTRMLVSDDNGNINTRLFSNLFSTELNGSSNIISNPMLSQVSSPIIKGRITAGVGNVEDLTPANVTSMLSIFTSTEKGLVPASGGGTENFLRADGVFAKPNTVGRQMITITSDITNNNATGNTLQDVTGLSFNVVAGTIYRFYAIIPYTSNSTNNGSRWTINVPTYSFLSYISRYTLGASSETVNFLSAPNLPLLCNNNSNVNENIATIEGVIRPLVNGVLQIRFASEIGGSSITAKAGASLEWW